MLKFSTSIFQRLAGLVEDVSKPCRGFGTFLDGARQSKSRDSNWEKRSVFLCGLVLRMLIFDRQNGFEPSACAPFVSRKLPLGLASVSDCAGWFMEYELAGLKPYDDERLVDAVALLARIAGAVSVGYRIEIPMRVAVPFKIDVLARC